MKNTSFAVRLTIPIVFTILLLFLATIFIVGYFINNLLREEAANRSYSALETSSLYINSNLKQVETAIANNAWWVEKYRDDTAQLHFITEKIIRENFGVIGSIVALNPNKFNGLKYAGYSNRITDNNHIRTTNISSRDYDYETMDWYIIPMHLNEAIWSEPYYDDGGANETITTYSYPIYDSDGEVFAILTADLSLKWLTSKATSIKPYEESQTMIVSRNGSFVVNSMLNFSSAETIFSIAFEQSDSVLFRAGKRMLKGISDDFEVRGIDNEGKYGVYGPLDNGWSILIVSNYDDVLAPNFIINIVLLILAFFVIVLVIVICSRLIHSLTKPIKQFSKIILNIADNKFDNEMPVIKSNDEIKVLRDAIDKMQSSIKDIQGAREIQKNLVPPQSLISDKFDLYAQVDPAKQVGGDLYDYHISTNRNKLYFLVGDVSGKGLPSALFMSMVVSAFRMISRINEEEKSIVTSINNTISNENNSDMFVTMFFASLDLDTLNMKFCNAGHNPPVLVYPDGSAKYLKMKSNLPLGAMEDFEYQDEDFQFEKGMRIIVYSDGVTEAERSDKELYGEERLLKWASSIPKDISSEDAVHSLREDVRSFTFSKDADTIQNDDITIMIITI